MAAPVFQNAGIADAGGAASSITAAFTTSGANRFVAVLAWQTTAQSDINSATYGGVSMNAEAQYQVSAGTRNLRLFHLAGDTRVALGANNIVVTYATSTSRPRMVFLCYADVDPTTPVLNVKNHSQTTPPPTASVVVNSIVGDMVVALGTSTSTGPFSFTWTSPAVELFDQVVGTTGQGTCGEASGTGAPITMEITASGNGNCSISAFNLRAVAVPPKLVALSRSNLRL